MSGRLLPLDEVQEGTGRDFLGIVSAFLPALVSMWKAVTGSYWTKTRSAGQLDLR
jgi:hypothetical protein